MLEGDANGAPHLEPKTYGKKFLAKYIQHTIEGGIGHNLPLEASRAFAQAVSTLLVSEGLADKFGCQGVDL